MWCIKEKTPAFVAKMEDVLEVCERPLNPKELLRSLSLANQLLYPSYKPGIGFFVKSAEGLQFLDREGRTTSIWKPEMREYLSDFTRDDSGR